MKLRRFTAAFAALLATSVVSVATAQPYQVNDLVIGVDSNFDDSFRSVRAVSGTPGVDVNGGTIVTGGPLPATPSPWVLNNIQSVEFDNSNGISHNAAGNLLGGNFGNGFNGFEIFNMATDGTGNFESLWNILEATGGEPGTNPMDTGPLARRGGGISVNPSNNRLAWSDFDDGTLNVMIYDEGATPGSGSGASITGWLNTADGDGFGNAGIFQPIVGTNGTTWLDDDTVIAATGIGSLVAWDISALSSSDISTPTQSSSWVEVVAPSGLGYSNMSNVDIEYQPAITDHIIISHSIFSGGIGTTGIIVLDPDTFAVVDRIDLTNSSETGREIALDTDGNLYVGGFGPSIVTVIPDFVSNIGSLTDDSSVLWFTNDFSSSFSGLDVATGAPEMTTLDGDFNGDGSVDILDLDILSGNFGTMGGAMLGDGDANGDGNVDILDLDILSGNFGAMASASAAVPEPAALAIAAVAACGLLRRRV